MKVFIGIIAQCRRPVTQARSIRQRRLRNAARDARATSADTPEAPHTTSHAGHCSNITPYMAWPMGCAHMDSASRQEITLPTSSPGVWLCTKAIICTLNNVDVSIHVE